MEENLKQQYTEIIKIVVLGPDCPGKDTLTHQLADYFDTVSVPDFAVDYLQNKQQMTKICEPEDLMPLAIGQTKYENDALLTANKFLFSNTCLLSTKIFSEINFNFCDPILEKAAKKHKYDLFFLIDFENSNDKFYFIDRPVDSRSIFNIYKSTLIENKKPFIILKGCEIPKLECVITIINDLIKSREFGLSSHDFVKIYEKGINIENLKEQIDTVKKGHLKSILTKPASINDGILKFSEAEFQEFSKYFNHQKAEYKLMKFVPASGAATRMFKFLIEFLEEFDIENETINAYINRNNASELALFITGLEKFPFFSSVDKKLKELYVDFNSWERDKKNYQFIKLLLTSEHFNYSNKPKGVLPFHKYASQIVTPIEEHLKESVHYASSNGVTHLHFTISEIHKQLFENVLNEVQDKIQKRYNVTINIEFSYQNSNTDTVALDGENNFYKNDEGDLVFRPAGHGALIKNLNSLDADVVFIKNIDNVSHNHIEIITLYKKGLAGILLQLQNEIFRILNQIEANIVTENDFDTIIEFIQFKLLQSINEDFDKYTFENKCLYIKEILNRPIRVCGMVKNEGEIGGGPFWVRDYKGNISLQIIESSQIDIQNLNQEQILKESTHFNPVDLVCGLKNFKGEKFDLEKFVDHTSGFVVEKSHNGTAIKSYELPGLWNGSMAKWNTIFVEVPLSTFNPVKTVNDLLKSSHQAK